MIPKTSELPFGRLRGFRRSFQAADVHGGPEMGGVRVPPLPGGDPHRQARKPRGVIAPLTMVRYGWGMQG